MEAWIRVSRPPETGNDRATAGRLRLRRTRVFRVGGQPVPGDLPDSESEGAAQSARIGLTVLPS